MTYAYDVTNRLTSRNLPNGVATTYEYDGMDRLTRLRDAQAATTIANKQFQYITANQITQLTDLGGAHAYGYDAVDRLVTASYPNTPTESYGYDAVGNRTSSHLSAGYSHQPFNRLTSTATATYTYDNNGNLVTKSDGSGTTQYGWDVENLLKQVTLPGGDIVSYKYDALGRRIERSALTYPSVTTTTRFIYDGTDVIRDTDASGVTTADYLNGPGIDNKIRQTANGTSLYFLADQLGSTRALTDAQGSVVEQINYDSFGNSSGSALTRYTYTGREHDALTNQLYYRARFYDPELGRFVSADPIAFNGGDINLYAYVGNNPSDRVDPLGLWATEVHEKIIDEAFRNCLSSRGRDWLKRASGQIDGVLNGGAWMERFAYQHGMRAPGQSVIEASNAAWGFINDNMRRARILAPQGCRSAIPIQALWEFGKDLHTITDMTSPAHAGFQVWHGPPTPTGVSAIDAIRYREYKKYADRHSSQETMDQFNSDPLRRRRIIQAASDAFKRTFGDCCCS